MKLSTTDTQDRVVRALNVRPSLSRKAALFVEQNPNEVTSIVAEALEEAAAVAALGRGSAKALPERLSRLVVGARQSEAGRFLSISEAAERLEVTRVTIYAWIESKRLLAWRATRRGVLIPAEQVVGPGEVVSGIERVLAIIPEPEAAWDFLDEESAFVDPDRSLRPIDALKTGAVEAVVAAAHSFLDAFS
jgi:excisionase family DNA binding protein